MQVLTAVRLHRRQHRRETGASLIEYAFLIALIAAVCFVAVQTLGTTTGTGLESDASSLFVR